MKPHNRKTPTATQDSSSADGVLPTLGDKIANYAVAAILVLVPFHALLTVWLSQLVGHYDLLRIWKEVLLLLITPLVAYLAWKTPDLWQRIRSSWLMWALACYVVLQVGLGLIALAKHQVNSYALLYAWVVNLRFVLLFAVAFVLAARSSWLHDRWKMLLIWPAVVVIMFGLLQRFVLPHDFLMHLGYNAATIAPYETVDQKLDYVRVQSTLRGANPLGAYLVIALTALMALLLRNKRDRAQIAGITVLSAGLLVLVATYSRSAYIGVFIAGLAAVALVVHGRQAKRRLAYGLAAIIAVAGLALLTLRTNDRFENVFFHTDEHSQSQMSSNQQRSTAYQAAWDDVLAEPFGRGPGTAGPASQHNDRPERIAENYYLQVVQETGWPGLLVLLVILFMVFKRLWMRRHDVLARVLLASLLGISFINLTSHAWTDDTLALVWWGLAGVACVPAIINTTAATKGKQTGHGKKANTRTT